MYKYYLFDLDGVLADTTMIQYESTREAILTIKKKDLLKEDFWKDIFLSTITTYEKLYQLYECNLISYEEIDIIYNEKKKIADSKFEMLQEDNAKIKLFDSLQKKGAKIAVVTNGNKLSSEIILKKIGLFNYIDIIISNNDVVHKKPHSEPYIRAMLHFGGKLEEYVIFEDSECGLQSARGTGCKVIHVKDCIISLD
jgi:HAD superfamily hydrolase (TIGR01509 family)